MTTTKPQRIVVAINPTASFGRGRPVGPAVVAALAEAGHDVVGLTKSTHADLVAATRAELASERRPDVLVVVGGDGMVSLGTNMVAGTGTGTGTGTGAARGAAISLGLVPSGTGNDMARSLGIPHDDPAAAIRLLVARLEHPPRVIDAGLVRMADGHETWIAGSVSAGFDAAVAERANRMRWPKGRARYDLALAIELLRLRRVAYTLVIDGAAPSPAAAPTAAAASADAAPTVDGTLIAVGNARSVGGGITLLPDAVLDDGLLDVLVVERLSRLQFLRLFPRVAKGTHTHDRRVTTTRATSIRIDADHVVAYGDGERLGPLPLEVTVVPGALSVIAPQAGPGLPPR